MSDEKPQQAKPANIFVLDDAAPLDTLDYDTRHPVTEEPTGWIVTFAGPAHPQSLALADKSAKEGLRRAHEIQKARINGKKFKPEETTPDEERRDFVEGLVARIVTWGGNVPSYKGKVYSFNPKDAVELLLFPQMGNYVKQFTDVLLEEKSFMPGSSKG